MAARKKKGKLESQATMLEGVHQVWLAGMGAIAKAQKEGPGAFQDAVSEGLTLLSRSRSTAEKMIRDALESTQESVQSRLDSARDQATETWDNLEALFQTRVQKALQQIGVPSADEIRLLTKRVAELNDNVKALASKPARGKAKKTAPPRARKTTRARRAGAAS
jgi:poly(hydroxyalkanoate) granule-associated protein